MPMQDFYLCDVVVSFTTLTSGKWWVRVILQAVPCLCAVHWLTLDGWRWLCRMGERFLSQEVKTQKAQKNHREATGSNNICSNVFDHSCYCAEMGHGCQRRIKHLVVVWVSGISDGPFSPCCQRCFLRIQSWQCFSAEELKSFRAFPLFCSLKMTDCSSLLAEGHYFFFVVVPV